MKKYTYMSLDNRESHINIKEKIQIEYGIKLSERLLEEDNNVLMSCVKKILTKQPFKNRFKEIANRISDVAERWEIEWLMKGLEEILSEPQSYFDDLIAACYMGILYNDKKMDSFKMTLPTKNDLKGKPEAQELVNDFKQKKTQMISAWVRKSNNAKINKKEARKNYPIPLARTSEEAEDEGAVAITSLPGGCFPYHHTMLSTQNIGIFDIASSTTSYKKYTYMRMYDIYRKIKDTMVENRLMLEFSLGVGYTNQIYHYLRNVSDYKDIEKMEEVIDLGANISPFFFRSKVIAIVWRYLELKNYTEEAVKYVVDILSTVQQYVSEVFDKMLGIWWYEYLFYENKDIRYKMSLLLENSWKNYFNDEEAYEDWAEFCGIYNWRKIKLEEELFCQIPNFAYTERQYTGKSMNWNEYMQVEAHYLQDVIGNERILYIEKPINKLGQQVLKMALCEMSKSHFPQTSEEVYKLYYNLRTEMYLEAKRKDEMKFFSKDVKVRRNIEESTVSVRTLKKSHVYAILQEMVIADIILAQ